MNKNVKTVEINDADASINKYICLTSKCDRNK